MSVRDDLRLRRETLLLAGVELLLHIGQARPADGGLEAVHQDQVQRVGVPGRLRLGPLLLGVPAVSRAHVAQEQDDLMKAVLAKALLG